MRFNDSATAARGSEPFGAAYSLAYDALYRDKAYVSECDFLEAAMKRYGSGGQRKILDLGCGTGAHAIELARRAYMVRGVDLSPDMLSIARAKCAAAASQGEQLDAEFVEGNIAVARVGSDFDVAIMMFAVLGYINDLADLAAVLSNVRGQLRHEGLLIADFWYGPAVLTQRPGDRVRIFNLDGRRLVRATHTDLDTFAQVARVKFTLFDWNSEHGLQVNEELHQMRYFFAPELTYLCASAGLSIRALCAFPSLGEAATESTWNAALIAQAT
jgi:SAM-dependent methyltransferase